MNSLSWKPVRRGSVYCAPACGGRCTYIAYLKASEKARKLAKRLGKGWKPHVWENLGWHYKVIFKTGTLSVHSDNSAWLEVEGRQWIEDEATTPELNVIKAIEAARSHAKLILVELAKL